jgi:glycosyltransferase involved in cell wall biosynthesis
MNLRPGRVGGAETYVRQLLLELPGAARESGDEVVVIAHAEACAGLEAPGAEIRVVRRGDAAVVASRMGEAFTPWRDRALARTFTDVRADAALFPQQSIYPRDVPVPAVLTVVDVQHLFFPEYFGAFDRAFRGAVYGDSLARASRIIAISEYTRTTLVEHCAVAPERVVAIPFGAPPPRPPAAPLEGLAPGYLYYPAATYPHKNHEALFRTYAALRGSGELSQPLVLTGQRTRHWPVLARTARRLGIGRDVRHLGFLPRADVARVYAGAAAVLFPTRFEGFGLPVLEAAQAGKKVITSRLTVFDEIGVPRRWQVDFADVGQVLSALRDPAPFRLERPAATWRDNALATLRELRLAAAAGRAPADAMLGTSSRGGPCVR